MRIVACLRVSSLPVAHVASTVEDCIVCHQAVWRDATDQHEDGDIHVCTACLPGYARITEAVGSALIEGRVASMDNVRPPTPAEAAEDTPKMVRLMRAMAEAFGVRRGADAKPKGPPS